MNLKKKDFVLNNVVYYILKNNNIIFYIGKIKIEPFRSHFLKYHILYFINLNQINIIFI